MWWVILMLGFLILIVIFGLYGDKIGYVVCWWWLLYLVVKVCLVGVSVCLVVVLVGWWNSVWVNCWVFFGILWWSCWVMCNLVGLIFWLLDSCGWVGWGCVWVGFVGVIVWSLIWFWLIWVVVMYVVILYWMLFMYWVCVGCWDCWEVFVLFVWVVDWWVLVCVMFCVVCDGFCCGWL